VFESQLDEARRISMGLVVVDMQNGFVAKGGSYDRLGMNTPPYRAIIPRLKELINLCKSIDILVFYTKQFGKLVG
jgi:ureidoacrylate peracid hydrolase